MRQHLSLILALAFKDWQLFLADRRAAVLCFAVPIVLASSFGMIFHETPESAQAPKLPLLIVDQDGDAFAQRVIADLLASSRVEAEISSLATAEQRVADRRPGVAVVLPAGFSELAAWQPGTNAPRPRIRILHNPLTASESHWAEGIVSEIVMQRLARERLSPWLPAATAEEAIRLPIVIETATVAGGSHAQFNAYSHSFCGMTLQYLLFWGMESGLLLLRERQRSLWPRLRAAPVPLADILLGKAVSTAFIAMLQVLATFAFGYLVFGVTISGSWIGFALLVLGVSTLAAATGLAVAAIGGTEARARSVCILLILGVSLLGGLWLPSFVLPGWARDLALALPTTWAMQGLDRVTWQGRGLLDVMPSVAVVFLFAAAFLAVAMARLLTSEARRRRGS